MGLRRKTCSCSSLYLGSLCHPNTSLTSNIYVQNITSTCVTEKNLADAGVIPDNKNKFLQWHTLFIETKQEAGKNLIYYKVSFPFEILNFRHHASCI
jgi:hypothetical protein